MFLEPFDSFFPDQDPPDGCKIIIADEVINGTFDVIDCYCPNPTCDCRMTTIAIIDDIPTIYATIAYGWEPKDFYHKCGFNQQKAKKITQGYLDPQTPQSAHAKHFLEYFWFLIEDPSFVDRLKNRYSIFRKEISSTQLHSKNNKVIPFKAKKRA